MTSNKMKQAIAQAQKGTVESILIAFYIWQKTKMHSHPKTPKEINDLIDLHRGLTQVVRNRLQDPLKRFEGSITEILNNQGGIPEFPDVEDPIWISAFTHSQNVVGNPIPTHGTNAIDEFDLPTEYRVILEKELNEYIFQKS